MFQVLYEKRESMTGQFLVIYFLQVRDGYFHNLLTSIKVPEDQEEIFKPPEDYQDIQIIVEGHFKISMTVIMSF